MNKMTGCQLQTECMPPPYLRGVRVPRHLVVHMVTVCRSHLPASSVPADPRAELLKVAWHETGHAVAWALNGGKVALTTIVTEGYDGGVCHGRCDYDVGGDWPKEDRLRGALAAMGAPAILIWPTIPIPSLACTISNPLLISCDRFTKPGSSFAPN